MNNIPFPIKIALDLLEARHYEAYLVGGAIRDFLLGEEPHDFDIATNAKPSEICEVFQNYRQINNNGEKHGTITVRIDETNIEITSYRGNSIQEDLYHRDLTINAIALSKDGTLIDPRGGQKDLANRLLTMGEDPISIIEEDPLRILRILRFHSSLRFDIDEKTKKAALEKAPLLSGVAKERILTELRQIMIAEDIDDILFDYREIFGILFPDLVPCFDHDQHNPWHANDLYTHIVHVVNGVPPQFILRTAALFHDIGKVPTESIEDKGNGQYVKHFYGHPLVSKKMTEPILAEYHFPIKEQKEILFLVAHHDNEIALTERSVKKALAKINEFDENPLPILEMLLDLQISDHNDHTTITPIHKAETLQIAAKILDSKSAFRIKDLDVDGYDLQKLGYQGQDIGKILNLVLDKVIANELPNQKEAILHFLQTN